MADTLEDALLALSARDSDMARLENGMGFNGRDTAFGNSLAYQIRQGRTLSPRQASAAYRMLRTYKVQLGRYGVDYDAIPKPEAQAAPDITGAARLEGDAIMVTFSGPPKHLLSAVKDVPGRRYNPETQEWMIPLKPETLPYIEVWPEAIVVDDAVREAIRGAEGRMDRSAELSRATDASIDLDIASRMYPFQRAGVAYVHQHGRVLIGDEMGLGKTVQALASLELEGAYPALVVVPAVVKLNWLREAERWVPNRTIQVLAGRKNGGITDADITIINYDILEARMEELQRVGWRAIVCDESHYLKNGKAKRTKAAIRLSRTVPTRMLLTGTPILNRPVELIAQLQVLGRLEDFGGFWTFAKRYCGAYRASFGWDMTGATNLPELHSRLRGTCYVRRTKEQVLTELPPKQRATVPIELTDPERYAETERALKRWLKERLLADEAWVERVKALQGNEEIEAELAAMQKERRMGRAKKLVKIEALKQVAAEEKLEGVKAWVDDFLTSGKKLVVFAHHKNIAAGLLEAYRDRAVVVTGETASQARQDAVDRFQTDDSVRLFIGNIQAAGVAFVELPWRPGDLSQAEDRCHRIGQDDSVTAWYLLAAGTIEERIARMIDAKRVVVDATTDGTEGLDPEDSLINALIEALETEAD
jgi:SWI/SNF-related matrix-associated actin-dependent regulator of chromatin subfamily A-like protein 1